MMNSLSTLSSVPSSGALHDRFNTTRRQSGNNDDDDDSGSYFEETVDGEGDEDYFEEEIVENERSSQQHHQQQEHEALSNDTSNTTSSSLSLNDILQDKLEKIAILEESNRSKDEALKLMEKTCRARDIEYKEQIYVLKLELGMAQRDQAATEERMAELYRDMQDYFQKGLPHTSSSAAGGGALSRILKKNNPPLVTLEDKSSADVETNTTMNTNFENESAASSNDDGDTKDDLEIVIQELKQKYDQGMGIFENQVSMVQTTCAEIIKTLKEELTEMMEERGRTELEMMNQLASLDHEKKTLEEALEQQVQVHNKAIQRFEQQQEQLQQRHREHQDIIEEYKEGISHMKDVKQKMQDQMARERDEADDEIHRLETANARLERNLDAAMEDLEFLRRSSSPKDNSHNDNVGMTKENASKVLDRVASERKEIIETLDRVATVWERADSSILNLEDIIDKVKDTPTEGNPNDDGAHINNNDGTGEVSDDRTRLLSTLETAALIHGQLKVSLLLAELRLRNQLQSLRNDKLNLGVVAQDDQKILTQIKGIQQEAMNSIAHVKSTLTRDIQVMQERALDETEQLKCVLRTRGTSLKTIQTEITELTEQVTRLKDNNNNDSWLGQDKDQNSKTQDTVPSSSTEPIISNQVVDQLQREVLRIIERVKHKNETIKALRTELETRKTREHQLKKELKRATRRPASTTNLGEDPSKREHSQPNSTIPRSPVATKNEIPSTKRQSIHPKGTISAVNDGVTATTKTGSTSTSLTAKKKSTKKADSVVLSPTQSSSPTMVTHMLMTPSESSQEKQKRKINGKDLVAATTPLSPSFRVTTPSSHQKGGIAPLRPSPREISKPRLTGPSCLSPTKSKGSLSSNPAD